MVKKLIRITIILFLLVAVLGFAVILWMRNYDSYPERGYIAHAGGAIDGYRYTNSREAVENAIAKGYKFIELDLALTTDSVLVALHDWALFRKICGMDSIDVPMTYEEFITQKIYGRFSPLSANAIDSIFAAHPETVLVTDKVDDADLLLKCFPSLRGRIMTECFSDEAYDKVKDAGIYPLRSKYCNYDKRIGRGGSYVLSEKSYYDFKKSKSYKIETRFLNSRMNLFILEGVADRSIADSLMEADPYVEHVYIDYLDTY